MSKELFEKLNSTIRYVMYSVFFIQSELPEDRSVIIADAKKWLESVDDEVVIRGFYDVSGLRADADYMIWWHAPQIEDLQKVYQSWRRETLMGKSSRPVWSAAALHRPAEFNKSHIPAFLRDEPAGKYICVYPFVRSYDWYLLPDEERKGMLAEHGIAARAFTAVRANTIASFALGDYEWILAFEAPELHLIVDLMRELRATEARRHVREEIPFFTGPKVELEQICSI